MRPRLSLAIVMAIISFVVLAGVPLNVGIASTEHMVIREGQVAVALNRWLDNNPGQRGRDIDFTVYYRDGIAEDVSY